MKPEGLWDLGSLAIFNLHKDAFKNRFLLNKRGVKCFKFLRQFLTDFPVQGVIGMWMLHFYGDQSIFPQYSQMLTH